MSRGRRPTGFHDARPGHATANRRAAAAHATPKPAPRRRKAAARRRRLREAHRLPFHDPACSSRRSPIFAADRGAQPAGQLPAARVSRRSRARARRLRHAVRAFPKADEGEMSRRLADLVRKEACADVARAIDLGAAIRLGASEVNAGGRSRIAILADVCEALIGAVFLDGGYPAAAALIERLERAHAHAGAAAARSQDRAAGMGAGARLADAGLSRGRAHRARITIRNSASPSSCPTGSRRKAAAAPSAPPSRPPPPPC